MLPFTTKLKCATIDAYAQAIEDCILEVNLRTEFWYLQNKNRRNFDKCSKKISAVRAYSGVGSHIYSHREKRVFDVVQR